MLVRKTVVGSKKEACGLEFYWWGWSQKHKWRWHGTHIDLGPLSIYEIKRPWLWLPLVWATWPMRWYYHNFIVPKSDSIHNVIRNPNGCPRVWMRMECPECGYERRHARLGLDLSVPHRDS